jgi:hypothetical protein
LIVGVAAAAAAADDDVDVMFSTTITCCFTYHSPQALLESAAKKKSSSTGEVDSSDEDGADAKPVAPAAKKSKIEKLFSRQNQVCGCARFFSTFITRGRFWGLMFKIL